MSAYSTSQVPFFLLFYRRIGGRIKRRGGGASSTVMWVESSCTQPNLANCAVQRKSEKGGSTSFSSDGYTEIGNILTKREKNV